MIDPLDNLYLKMLIKEENVETISHTLPKEILDALKDLKTIQMTDHFQQEINFKINHLTKMLYRYIAPKTKQPVQVYKGGIRIK